MVIKMSTQFITKNKKKIPLKRTRKTGANVTSQSTVQVKTKNTKEFAKQKWNIEKRDELVKQLDEADRRFNIAVGKMSAISDRINELGEGRNLALRKQFLANEIKKHPDNKELKKEFDSIRADDRDIEVYEEVLKGYKPMSRRKNELQEERNHIVKDIENVEKEIGTK